MSKENDLRAIVRGRKEKEKAAVEDTAETVGTVSVSAEVSPSEEVPNEAASPEIMANDPADASDTAQTQSAPTAKTRRKPSDTVQVSETGEKLYTPTQAATLLHTTTKTIHAHIKQGKIAAIKFGPRGASHITETELKRLRAEWNII